MKNLIFALIASSMACSNPAGPSPTRPEPPLANPVTLSMTVMGNTTRQPLVGVATELDGMIRRTTDSQGKAYWQVEAGTEHAVAVCGHQGARHLVSGPGEVGWLTSVPESECGR